LAEGETVIVMNERVVETVNAGDPTKAFFVSQEPQILATR
jgi:hypothetical protein